MVRCVRGSIVAMVVTLAGMLAQNAQASRGDTPVRLDELPKAVRQAAAAAVPGAKLTEAYRYIENGKTYYELSGFDAQHRAVDVDLTPQGGVVEVQTEIPIREVPKVVVDAVKVKTRGQRMTFGVVQVVTSQGQVVAYQFEGVTSDDDDVEVTVSPDGRDVEVEIDDSGCAG
jgi:hypothetical protein